MHCAINAIEAGVPTIFIAYSQKAVGMAEYVYGNKKWVIPIEKLTEDRLLALVKAQLSEKDSIKISLAERNKGLQKSTIMA